jgi:hypothetical protein
LGALFENLIIAERLKQLHHVGNTRRLYFYRDSNQLEIDLLEDKANVFALTEIKASRTFRHKLLSNLHKVADRITDKACAKTLIYGGEEEFMAQQVQIRSWRNLSPN